MTGVSSFNVAAESRGAHEVIKVTGDLDVYSATWLREASIRAAERGRYHQVIDLERCVFVDMTGLGAIVGALKRVRQHDGTLQIVCTSAPILAKFRMTGIEKVLDIHPDLDTALQEATS